MNAFKILQSVCNIIAILRTQLTCLHLIGKKQLWEGIEPRPCSNVVNTCGSTIKQLSNCCFFLKVLFLLDKAGTATGSVSEEPERRTLRDTSQRFSQNFPWYYRPSWTSWPSWPSVKSERLSWLDWLINEHISEEKNQLKTHPLISCVG